MDTVDILLKKIISLSKVNDEIISRIKGKQSFVVNYNYAIACYTAPHLLKDEIIPQTQLFVEENKTENLVQNILNSWKRTVEIKVIKDIFNDKINYEDTSFNGLCILNSKMVEVAAKYEMFGDTEKTKVELKLFIINLEQIKVELGKIEEKMVDIPNTSNEFQKEVIKLNDDILAINTRYASLLKRIKPAEFKNACFYGQTRINGVPDIGFKLISSRKALISYIQIIRQVYGEITLDVYNNNKKLINTSSVNQSYCTSGPFTWSLPSNERSTSIERTTNEKSVSSEKSVSNERSPAAIFYFYNLIIEPQLELFFSLRYKNPTKIDCFTAYDANTEEKSIFAITPTVKIYKTSTVYPNVAINYC